MAVDLAHFKPSSPDPVWAERWKLVPGEKVVLFVGRWVKEKGVLDILDAIPHILQNVTAPVRFCFVGAGPLENKLHQAAEKYPGRVLFSFHLCPTKYLPVLHNMADVFILPSKSIPKWREQFGYVLAESMACAKAIVTTRSGSIPDVVGSAASLIPEE